AARRNRFAVQLVQLHFHLFVAQAERRTAAAVDPVQLVFFRAVTMAKRSPPIPFETGSINPRVALAAIAASTALPPRFKISSPTCVAAGTLVQTIPCRARTSDRVAKDFPVMRSICASSEVTEIAPTRTSRTRSSDFMVTTAVIPRESRGIPWRNL